MSTPQFQHLDAASEEQAVRRIVESLAESMNRCDAAAFASHFTEDGEFTNVFGTYSRGRDAIRKLHEPLFAPAQTPGMPSFRNALLTIRDVRVRPLRPDIAAVDVRWNQIGAVRPDGTPWQERRGLLNLITVKDGGTWRIAVSHNLDLP